MLRAIDLRECKPPHARDDVYVDDPERVGAAWDEALAADRPVVLEAYADPNVPPLPPHLTLAQAKAFMSSLPKDPEFGSVLKDTAKEVAASLLPR
jgi:pyruvate dehydrogenase (quinone)